jgi:hypothetical protein
MRGPLPIYLFPLRGIPMDKYDKKTTCKSRHSARPFLKFSVVRLGLALTVAKEDYAASVLHNL